MEDCDMLAMQLSVTPRQAVSSLASAQFRLLLNL
jgi:hypothetical protein